MSLPRTLPQILSTSRQILSSSTIKSRYRPSSLRHHPLPSLCATCLHRSLQTAAATPYRPENLDLPNLDPSPPRNKNAPKSELTRVLSESQRPAPFTTIPVDGTEKKDGSNSSGGDAGRVTLEVPSSAARMGTSALENRQSPPSSSGSTVNTPSTTSTASQPPNTTRTSSISPTTSTTTTPRKLRPRKAAMNLTPLAIHHIRSLTNLTPPKLIRVGVKNRGCSGLAYHLEYISQPGRFDEVVEQDGVKVYIDSKALFSIIGSEMDWVEDKLSARFVFKNPNIKEQCGCGESFMV